MCVRARARVCVCVRACMCVVWNAFITDVITFTWTQDVTHVAVTVGPGLAPCLKAGLVYAKNLCKEKRYTCM